MIMFPDCDIDRWLSNIEANSLISLSGEAISSAEKLFRVLDGLRITDRERWL